ncbi:hypothetical protein Droror1_Dr00008582 [Drosera rotundifolia]
MAHSLHPNPSSRRASVQPLSDHHGQLVPGSSSTSAAHLYSLTRQINDEGDNGEELWMFPTSSAYGEGSWRRLAIGDRGNRGGYGG